MPAPFEIIAAPLTLYLAPVGTAFPALLTAPPVAWIKVGTSGDRNYDEDGVSVAHKQKVDQARPVGTTGPVKAWRTEEDLLVSVNLWDLTVEQYAKAMHDLAITTTAAGTGTAGFKKIGLSRGGSVAEFALLARGTASAYGEGWIAQYEVPRCYQSGDPKPNFRKGKPAGLELEFTALEDLNTAIAAERFGRLLMQHAAALP